MRWLLAGCFGFVLINISVAPDPAMQIIQKPRFIGLPVGHRVFMLCLSYPVQTVPAKVEWYKADEYDMDKSKTIKLAAEKGKYDIFNITVINKSIKKDAPALVISNINIKDSGVYFCKMNDHWGPGTGLHVSRDINIAEALHRTRMKDGLIILQGLVLAVCIAAFLLRKQHLLEKKDSIYEEPETDHIYEGLAIETCGGGLYEELSIYAEAEGAEAPWEKTDRE
ncbi:uncharacterized protein cd79b [Plectropomus leopardus]|uniref:uncharacterized protein cd79b n=1 Tax=Plectropomus leopardus TaxID=160734 RepID=UPI001C4D313C|nr:uncharacterized protein cd79b [Plectropomus leopardus]